MPLGSGRVGSDNLGYGPGSGFSFEPVQTSTDWKWFCCQSEESRPGYIMLRKGSLAEGQAVSSAAALGNNDCRL